jgi:alkylation response protein AidB-like acyl-CoA dehydrogenase
MRGSGSHDIAAEGITVPAERMFDAYDCVPCIRSPTFVMPPLHIHLHLSSVALGIAQGAIDDIVALAKSGKKRLYARDSLIESSAFRNQLGRNVAAVRAGRAVVRDSAERFWALCAEGREAATEMAPEIMSATSWVVETCAEVVKACYRTSGASAIRNSSRLQRRFRDISVVTQHVAASEGWFGQAGGVALGVPFSLKA